MKQIYNLFFVGLFGAASYAQCTTPTLTNVTGTSPICSGNTATLSATTDVGSVLWFNMATGGTQVGEGISFVTPPLSATTSYWAEARNSGTGTPSSGWGKLTHGTESSTVNTASDPWGLAFTATSDFILNSVDVFLSSGTAGDLVIHLKDQNYSILQTLTIPVPAGGSPANPVRHTLPLNLIITGGNSYKLVAESGPAMIRDLGSNSFPYNIGTVGSITGGTINNSTSNNTVYYFFYNWNYTPGTYCASARQEVMVTVNPIPAAPTASAQTFCDGATVAQLAADGSNLKWYSASTGGDELTGNTALAEGAYYVSQSANGCESARTTVSVTVNPVPDAPQAEAQAFCGQATVAELQGNGTNLKWYTDAMGGTALADTAPLSTGTYYVSQTTTDCESERTAVAINVNDIPDAPEANAQLFCGAASVSDLLPNGEAFSWYESETGTALTPNTQLAEGTYYVKTTENGCVSAFTSVEVTINPTPGAPVGANEQTVDEGDTIANLVVTGEDLTWYADDMMNVGLSETTVLEDDTTYYVMQTVDGCPSSLLAITVNVILGIHDNVLSGLTFYPNPVEDNFTITNTQPISNIRIYSLLGQKVMDKVTDSETVSLDLSKLAAGTYIVKIQSGNAVKNIRIAKK